MISNTSRVGFGFGGPVVGKACFELWLPHMGVVGLNLESSDVDMVSMEIWDINMGRFDLSFGVLLWADFVSCFEALVRIRCLGLGLQCSQS